MPLTSGSRFGAYEIGPALGAGGMGEVYRATDTRLKRDVAIKVLPATFAGDAERLARFQREAELLAALNHPHIAAIYGLEDKDGVTALVMELVDGNDLSRLIPPGGLTATEALAIAKQIAEALEAAHEQGIIHRDLKPANVKVRPDGTVKVLDFGLAKALDQGSGIRDQGSGDLVNSPTITSPAMTMRGVILGTAAYMSPEQARGRVVDKRTDIWAFGAVLYEMLTGARAFQGEDVSMTLAAVMKSDPDLRALPDDLPAAVRVCIDRCLQKDPKRRLRDIGDARLVLEGAFESQAGSRIATAPPLAQSWWRRVGPPVAVAIVASAATGFVIWSASPVEVRPVIRFEYPLPGDRQFRTTSRRNVAASADGQRFVYNAPDGMYLHEMDGTSDRLLLASTSALTNPVFSPDGTQVAFFQLGQLKRLPISGGAPVVINSITNPVGITWADDGMILFAEAEGIRRVSDKGGHTELVVKAVDGETLSSPQVLPGNVVLFTSRRGPTGAGTVSGSVQIETQSLATDGQRKVILQSGSDGHYVHTGHLVYTVGTVLFGVGFDVRALQTTGSAVSLVEDLRRGPGFGGLADFEVSSAGALFYVGGGASNEGSPLAWVDRTGRSTIIAAIPTSTFGSPRLSVDEQRLLAVADGDVRIHDLATGRETRVTNDRTAGEYVAWVPGERSVAYSGSRLTPSKLGVMNIWLQPLDGTGRAEPITDLAGQVHVDSWSPDGRTLMAHHHIGGGISRLIAIPIGERPNNVPKPYVEINAAVETAVFSPDGRFTAYLNAVSGQNELIIRPYPGPGPETTVSVGGAREPAWAKNGELFYRRPGDDMLMVVKVTTTPTLRIGPPAELFRGSGTPGGSPRASYDVTADGQRFIMSASRLLSGDTNKATRPRVNIVLNWVEELRQRVPRDR